MATAGPELLIARHGYAHCTEARTIAGPGCTGLTAIGQGQAKALAARLYAEGGITWIHASTTPRAWETATIVADAVGVPAVEQHDLRVPDPGDADGELWRHARATYPIDPDNPVRPLAGGGETWHDYLTRAIDALSAVLARPATGRILVVGHNETITAAFALFLGTHDLGHLKVTLDCTGLTRWQPVDEYPGVTVPAARWALVGHNDTTHLAAT